MHRLRYCTGCLCTQFWISSQVNNLSTFLQPSQIIVHVNLLTGNATTNKLHEFLDHKHFDTHGSVNHRLLSRNTNKMQLCNRIYYYKVYWRLNMFRAAHRSSSGALNCICCLWSIYPCGYRPLPRLSGPASLGNGRSPHGHINQRLQIQFGAPDDERCAARNTLSLQKNFGIINSITKLHLVGISAESQTLHWTSSTCRRHLRDSVLRVSLFDKIGVQGENALQKNLLTFKNRASYI